MTNSDSQKTLVCCRWLCAKAVLAMEIPKILPKNANYYDIGFKEKTISLSSLWLSRILYQHWGCYHQLSSVWLFETRLLLQKESPMTKRMFSKASAFYWMARLVISDIILNYDQSSQKIQIILSKFFTGRRLQCPSSWGLCVVNLGHWCRSNKYISSRTKGQRIFGWIVN